MPCITLIPRPIPIPPRPRPLPLLNMQKPEINNLVFVNRGCKFARGFNLKESIKRFFSLDLAAVSDNPPHGEDKEKVCKW